MAVNQQSAIDKMGRVIRQREGIPKGSLPTETMNLAELLHLINAKRRMLVMGPAREHKHPPRARRSNIFSLSTKRAVSCNVGRAQAKGWVLLGKSGEAPQGQSPGDS